LNRILAASASRNSKEATAVSKITGRRTILTSIREPLGSTKWKDKTSWQPEDNIDIQRVTQKAIVHELTQQQSRTIESVVPWYLDIMPSAYFRQVPYDFRMSHIKAISAVRDANMELYLNLKSPLPDGGEGEVLTFIRPGKKMGQLRELIQELPWVQNTDSYVQLSRMQIFIADDESMTLSMFIYGDVPSINNEEKKDVEEVGARILDYAAQLQNGEFLNSDQKHPTPSTIFEREEILTYLRKCSETYVSRIDPFRFLHHRELYQKVTGTEGVAVIIHKSNDDQFWVDIAAANSLPQVALEHATRLLYLHQLDVQRCHLDVVKDEDNGNVSLLRILVSPMSDSTPSDETLNILKRQMKRTKWLDPATMDLAIDKYPSLGLDKAEIITAISALMHPIMAKKNSFIFSRANILDTLTNSRYISHSSNIAELFLDRFNPHNPLSDDDFTSRCEKLREEISSQVEDTSAEELLNKMIDVVQCTLKTNLYLEHRYSLALRLHPKIMHSDDDHELPYGVFFIHGRRFNGYHVRFRDIARGGMRLVTPPTLEQLSLESARHYDECYGLAFAQQMKNKDIPEGGSKAVVLINHGELSSQTGKNIVVRKSVKAFTDSLLDLIVDTQETRENIVNLLGRKELLYLGPDEQVIPLDINWVVQRAAKRGYDTPAAFMSSKPRAGINHKEYGVTSEGVNVFLDVALREALNIDPTTQPFTIKMTGGPDGDVAGNEIKILFREYGDNAKIVGIADHSGSAEDPNGLDHQELLRLVENSMSIGNFDESKLTSEGNLYLVSSEEGVNKRNSMHNRVVADAFIPCGGRPNTIDKHNYRNFLMDDGKPSSPLVVEAANIFITEEARQALYEEAGVVIVKDSSANKCGVITSSYEICAAMLLTEDEFFENKQAIVDDVLLKLRDLAKMEADLLFREFKHYSGSCPHFSKVISKSINNVKDEVIEALNNLTDDDMKELLPLFRHHLPKTLADLSFDRVCERVPKQYIRNAIASSIASKIVYREGTIFVQSQPKDGLAQLALDYVSKEKEIALLIEALRNTDVPEDEKNTIINLLDAGGVRTALKL